VERGRVASKATLTRSTQFNNASAPTTSLCQRPRRIAARLIATETMKTKANNVPHIALPPINRCYEIFVL